MEEYIWSITDSLASTETPPGNPKPIHIRSHLEPGDIGYITYLHGLCYAREYGLDYTLEGYVAAGLAQFIQSFDPRKDCLWIAEMDGQRVGSIGIVGQVHGEAQLRWFLVHPACRGRGLGLTLLKNALQFCRERQFKSVLLWTFSDLEAAAHLYQSVGFHKTKQKPIHFGAGLSRKNGTIYFYEPGPQEG